MNASHGCVVCSQHKKTLMEVFACDSCIAAHIPTPMSQLRVDYNKNTSVCLICAQAQAGWEIIRLFHICVACLLECQQKSQKLSPVPKVSFLQQFDPSPLSSDFKGDVSIVVKDSDECIQAHQYILAGRSPVFKKMMEMDMKEKLSGVVEIGDMSAPTVRAAVNFMYTGDIEFSDEVRAEDMLRFADLYEVQWLKDVCEAQLVKNISSGNLMEIFSISYGFRAEKVKESALKYFTEHPEVHKPILDSIFKNL